MGVVDGKRYIEHNDADIVDVLVFWNEEKAEGEEEQGKSSNHQKVGRWAQ